MKILHLCSEKGWRGGEQQVAYLVEELARLNASSIIALKKDSALEKFCVSKNIPYYPLKFSNSLDFISGLKIKKFCRQNKIDVIHTHTSIAHGVAVLSALFGNPTPIIVSRRVDFIPKNNFMTRWKYNYSQIRFIAGVSQKITEIMQRYIGHPEKCVTVYSGVDLNRFTNRDKIKDLRKEFGIDSSKTLVGNTAALADHKDYFTFIDTIEKIHLSGKPVHGLIIGNGPMEADLKSYVLQKNLQHLILFTGFRNDIPEILPGLDIFLMTSKEEGLGTSLLDAFLSQVPVVATNAGGIPELIHPGETGLLASVGDSQSLSEAVIRLIDSPEERNAIVERAFLFAKKFSKEETAKKTHALYLKVLQPIM